LEALIRVLEEAKRGNLSVQIKDEDVPEGLKPVGRLINDLLGTLAQCLRVQEESLEHYRKILDTLQETYYEVDLGGHLPFSIKLFFVTWAIQKRNYWGPASVSSWTRRTHPSCITPFIRSM